MNTTTLNVSELSYSITDVFNVYIQPPICLIGILLTLVIVRTTFSLRHQSFLFRLFCIRSTSDLIVLIIYFPLFIVKCVSLCSQGYSYWAKVYESYLSIFLGGSLQTFSSLLEIISIIFQYLLIEHSQSLFSETKWYLVVLVSAVVSFLVSSMALSVRGITPFSNGKTSDLFILSLNSFGHTNAGRILLLIYGLVRGLLIVIIMLILNMLLIISYRKYLNRKKHVARLKNSTSVVHASNSANGPSQQTMFNSSKSNMARLVRAMGIYFLLTNLPYAVGPFLVTFNLDSAVVTNYSILMNFIFYMSKCLIFFIFLFFNRSFYKYFISSLKKIFRR